MIVLSAEHVVTDVVVYDHVADACDWLTNVLLLLDWRKTSLVLSSVRPYRKDDVAGYRGVLLLFTTE